MGTIFTGDSVNASTAWALTMKAQPWVLLLFCLLFVITDADRTGRKLRRKKSQSSGRSFRLGNSRSGSTVSSGTQCTLVKETSGQGGDHCFDELECSQQCTTVNEQQCS